MFIQTEKFKLTKIKSGLKNKHIILATLICLFLVNASAQFDNSAKQQLHWELGYKSQSGKGSLVWVSSTVPGAVQLDIGKAEKYGLWYYAENWKDYLWMEDQYFTYRTTFKKPDFKSNEQIFFVSEGIDYTFEIALNGEKLLKQEGMFTPVKINLTQKLNAQNELTVLIYPVPKSVPNPADRTQANRVVKPAVSYSWDWHPRLIPSGIWDETYLLTEAENALNEVFVTYNLNDSLTKANIRVNATGIKLNGLKYNWVLKDPEGKTLINRDGIPGKDEIAFDVLLNNPELWWPHDHGKQNLYTWQINLIDKKEKIVQSKAATIGFRRVRLVTNKGVTDPEGYPKSRMYPPFQLEINGRRIFGKGTNWVNPEVFPGIITAARYEELVNRAVEGNMNIFRIWGGGIINKKSFYEICDRKGVMVWQEFPLSCNNYPDDPHYLQILEQESQSIIRRLRNNPSVVLWCGGNELFNSWGGMTDQSLALRLLNSQCLKFDPNTPFIPTSPIDGVKHGHYEFRDQREKTEVFALMANAKATAYTEFGIPAPASVEILKSIIPPTELWPPVYESSWKSHHAFYSWGKEGWLMKDLIEDYFGKMNLLEELVYYGQLLQGEGYKCIYETARQQKPYCSMALNWCYNEPWPTAANNSFISYPNIPKPGFYHVCNACRPVLASATINKFTWKSGELFKTQLWMLNDKFDKIGSGQMVAKIVSGNQEFELGKWNFEALEPNTNKKGPELFIQLPEMKTGIFKLILQVEGRPEYNSEYLLLMK
jgi:beta-mannosidase